MDGGPRTNGVAAVKALGQSPQQSGSTQDEFRNEVGERVHGNSWHGDSCIVGDHCRCGRIMDNNRLDLIRYERGVFHSLTNVTAIADRLPIAPNPPGHCSHLSGNTLSHGVHPLPARCTVLVQ